MRRWEVVVVAACVLLVLWAWWPRPQRHRLEEHEVVFGQTTPLTEAQGTASSIVGTVFPFPSGNPTRSVNAEASWPDWPDPATLNDEAPAHCFSINCAYDAATNRALSIWAYLEYGECDGPETDHIRAAIYRLSDGAFLGATEAQLVTQGAPAAWYAFSFGEAGPVLVPATEYALVVWGQNPSGMDTGLWGGDLSDYTEPAVISGSDTIVLSETLSGYGPGFAASDVLVLGEALGNYGPGFAASDVLASDVLAFEENLRHGGVIAPCDGRFIPPEPEEYCTNPHRWNG